MMKQWGEFCTGLNITSNNRGIITPYKIMHLVLKQPWVIGSYADSVPWLETMTPPILVQIVFT